MNVAVMIKLVPNTETKFVIDNGKVNENEFKYFINPYDEFAVEQAVQFKESFGGKVTLITLFKESPEAERELRKMLAIGADEVIYLKQENYRGDRPGANAKILAETLKELSPDLIIGGVQGIDYYQMATLPMIAQKLGVPHVASATKLECNGNELTAYRQVEGGVQIMKTSMPAVITCQKDMNVVRRAALKDIMASKRKPIEYREVSSSESIDMENVEDSLPPARGGGKLIEGETAEQKVDELIRLLREEAKII